ncbi:MAG: acyltransferase [Deltaproteobacteria bacterium]|nr:acyltransferase [Deltaproteobacteria bacterium]
MRREHRPYYLKRAKYLFERYYAEHFVHPHFDYVGEGATFFNPWYTRVFGPRIEIGRYTNVVATTDKRVSFVVWPEAEGKGRIAIGDYTIINPGVRITSAREIVIGRNCLIAGDTLISDADWHDIYDRVWSSGNPAPIRIDENVWLCDSVIVCKGVTIGRNSVIGAGSIVVKDIPPNTVAAGNPAKPVKAIDPNRTFITREQFLKNPDKFYDSVLGWEKEVLGPNTLFSWLRYLLFPRRGD